jgi:hypothetical protein
MATKHGYKLVLSAGPELLHVLAISQRKQIGPADTAEDGSTVPAPERAAIEGLLKRGVAPAKAASLTRLCDPEVVLDQIEYAEHLLSRDRRQKIDNPAGFLIYIIENRIPVPTGFVTSRARKRLELIAAQGDREQARRLELDLEYNTWVEAQVDEHLHTRYPGESLQRKIKDIVAQRVRSQKRYSAMSPDQQHDIALLLLKRDLRDEAVLPTLEEWRKQGQMRLL